MQGSKHLFYWIRHGLQDAGENLVFAFLLTLSEFNSNLGGGVGGGISVAQMPLFQCWSSGY